MSEQEGSKSPQMIEIPPSSRGASLSSSAEAPTSGAGGVRPVRWYEVLTALIFLSVFGYFALQWGIEGVIHNRKVQVVPDLQGKPVSAALDALSSINLAVRKEGVEFNADVPIATVLRQNPPAGAKVREGKIVRVVISQGGQTVFVPNLIGLPLRNAEMMLRENQLALGEVTESYSLKMDKGMVLSQNPKAEASVSRNSLIHAVISGGPPPTGIVLMPDFQRKNMSEAQGWANGAGIEISVTKDPAALFPYGVILSQDPVPDSVLSPGTKVRVTISGRTSTESGQAATKPLHYAIPQGSSDNLVRIVLADSTGERELFNGLRPPGSKIDLQVPVGGEEDQARLKIYLNGILVEDRDW